MQMIQKQNFQLEILIEHGCLIKLLIKVYQQLTEQNIILQRRKNSKKFMISQNIMELILKT